MRGSAKRVATFCAIALVLHLGLCWYYHAISIRNVPAIRTDREFHGSDEPIDVLILGHSRPLKAVDAQKIPRAVNFSSGGETNVQTFYKLRYVLEQSKRRIARIVLPMGFLSFGVKSIPRRNLSSYWIRYVDYLEIGRATNQFFPYLSHSIKSRLVPYHQYPAPRLDIFHAQLTKTKDQPKFSDLSAHQQQQAGRETVERNLRSRTLYDSVSLDYLRRTLELCRAHDVEMLFLEYPISAAYSAAVADLPPRFESDARRFESVIATFDEHTRHVDFSELYHLRNEYFQDPQHLNEAGRAAFTRVLRRELERSLPKNYRP